MKTKILSVVLVLAMLLSCMPITVFSVQETATVDFSVFDGDFFMPLQKITATKGLAADYGYEVSKQDHNGVTVDGVTVFDVLVAAHIAYYAQDFTKETAQQYLVINKGFITRAFNKKASNSGFTINGVMKTDGIINPEYGTATGYAADTAVVENDDYVSFFYYQDTSYYSDLLTFFDQDACILKPGDTLTLNLKGYCVMWYGFNDAETIESHTSVIPSVDVYVKSENTGFVKQGTTDENGNVTLSFDEPGTYLIGAKGTVIDEYEEEVPIISPWCSVTVEEPVSDSNQLSELRKSLSPALTPEFDPMVTDYTLALTSTTVSSVFFYTTAKESTSVVTGHASWWADERTDVMSSTGSSYNLTSIPGGNSTFEITVTPQAGDDTPAKTYTVSIYRPLSDASQLSSLKVDSADSAKAAMKSKSGTKEGTLYRCDYDSAADVLTPTETTGFTGATGFYYTTVNYYVDTLRVTAKISSTVATAGAITYKNLTNGAVVAVEGSVSGDLPLNPGINRISIDVTSEDGTSTTQYLLEVYRLPDVAVKEISISCGDGKYAELETSTFMPGLYAVNAQIDKEAVSYELKIGVTKGASVTYMGNAMQYVETQGDIDYYSYSDEAIAASQSYINKMIEVTKNVNGEDIVTKYTLSIYRHNNLSANRVEEYVHGPGQYSANATYSRNIEKTIRSSGSLVSLGGYGGYVTYAFDEPIANSAENKYGVDFLIKGNSFLSGGTGISAAEPAAVMVAQDLDCDGKPDQWYQLAPANYYTSHVVKNYSRTYTNVDGKAIARHGLDAVDLSGYGYTYFPDGYSNLFTRFGMQEDVIGKNQTTLINGYRAISGLFLIGSGNPLGNGENEFTAEDLVFGYADVHVNGSGNEASNPYKEDQWTSTNGDGFDISWAVDENGSPVYLENISFVKVYTASGYKHPAFGEKSPELTTIIRTDKNEAASAQTQNITQISIGGKAVDLSNAVSVGEHQYALTVSADTLENLNVSVSGNENDNIFVNAVRFSGHADTQVTLTEEENQFRIIKQTEDASPVLYVITVKGFISVKETSNLVLDESESILYGLTEGKNSVQAIFDELDYDKEAYTLRMINAAGNEISGTVFAGTGCKVQLLDGAEVVDEITIVLFGDANGDGVIDVFDYAYIVAYMRFDIDDDDLTKEQLMACDVSGDGWVDEVDLIMLDAASVFIIEIDQRCKK